MDNPFRLILASLAVYRLSQLVALDNGPGFMSARLRGFFGRRASKESNEMGVWHQLAEFINCPFCLGVWFSLIITLAAFNVSNPVEFVLIWLGMAGVQAALEGRNYAE